MPALFPILLVGGSIAAYLAIKAAEEEKPRPKIPVPLALPIPGAPIPIMIPMTPKKCIKLGTMGRLVGFQERNVMKKARFWQKQGVQIYSVPTGKLLPSPLGIPMPELMIYACPPAAKLPKGAKPFTVKTVSRRRPKDDPQKRHLARAEERLPHPFMTRMMR